MRPVTVKCHFGEWWQGRIGPDGPDGPVALVTLVCPVLQVIAPGDDPLPFGDDQLAHFFRQLGLGPARVGGAAPVAPGSPPEDIFGKRTLQGVSRNFPLGVGAGGSTATLVALALAAGYDGPPETLARACVAVEGASDPLMFPAPDRLIWASRRGQVLRDLAAPPRAEVLGGLWGAPLRTEAEDADFDDVTDLATDWMLATERGDLASLAAIASESARLCTARRGPGDPMADLARDLNALGVIRAHTGSARGLVFAPGEVPAQGAAALQEAGLTEVLRFGTGGA